MIRTQCEHCHIGYERAALHGVQYASRIIHHAKGIDLCAELIEREQPADMLGETRACEENTGKGRDAERGFRELYGGSKFHEIKKEGTCPSLNSDC